MAVLVTRPHPDSESTAAALRAEGFEVLEAPMLRFEPIAFRDDMDGRYGAVVLTSANALRAIEPRLKSHHLLELPLFAVGEQTAAAARRAGFTQVISAKGDATDLRDLVLASVKTKQMKGDTTLLYLAGADIARDLAGELGGHGLRVITHATYRMSPVTNLPREVCEAFAASAIEAVLHYSQRSARAFIEAARTAGVEISALAVPQCCISAAVASVIRDAGAARVMVAESPDENALFRALGRALRPVSR